MPTMKISFLPQRVYHFLLNTYRWYLLTAERSLDQAYKAALQIKAIEDEHFNGNKIDFGSSRYTSSMMDYFESDLKKQLKIARMRLTEFKASRLFLNESNQKAVITGIEYTNQATILEKLRFIDQVIAKYTNFDYETTSSDLVTEPKPEIVPLDSAIASDIAPAPLPQKSSSKGWDKKPRNKANSTGILPRSILSTVTRLQVELDPRSEEDVVKNFRQAQRRTIISVRFLLLLIIVPILTHQLSKTLIVGPIVDSFRSSEQTGIFINYEMEEEALQALEKFEERTKFDILIGRLTPLSVEEMENQVKEKAREIAEEFRAESSSAIKNVFADLCSVVAVIWLMLVSKPSIAVIKDFFDNIVYGLSDSAKAFIIILFTDIFVGFHSPHGWEVLLEGVSRHWGLPGNHEFIFLFIATFPVILDTIFKYWIFRYLNRISPSAVATYRNMNE
ncbi:MAG: proton extrusion protein PcxA [Hassallia sp.]